jgi:tyrosinase
MYPNDPESYVVPEVNHNGTRSTAPGTIEDLDSPLMPFAFDDTGVMHTAQTVQHTHLLGYSYAELQHLHLTADELAAQTFMTVQQLYGNETLWTG